MSAIIQKNYPDVNTYRNNFWDKFNHLTKGASINSQAIAWGMPPENLRIWRNKSVPNLAQAAVLADATGVSLDWLVGRPGAVREEPPRLSNGADTQAIAGTPYINFDIAAIAKQFAIAYAEVAVVAVSQLPSVSVCVVDKSAIIADGIWVFTVIGDDTPTIRRVARRTDGKVALYSAHDGTAADAPVEILSAAMFKRLVIGKVLAHDVILFPAGIK